MSGILSLPEPFETVGGRSFAYNNFLAKEGYDLKKEQAQWRQRIKARQAAATQAAQ